MFLSLLGFSGYVFYIYGVVVLTDMLWIMGAGQEHRNRTSYYKVYIMYEVNTAGYVRITLSIRKCAIGRHKVPEKRSKS